MIIRYQMKPCDPQNYDIFDSAQFALDHPHRPPITAYAQSDSTDQEMRNAGYTKILARIPDEMIHVEGIEGDERRRLLQDLWIERSEIPANYPDAEDLIEECARCEAQGLACATDNREVLMPGAEYVTVRACWHYDPEIHDDLPILMPSLDGRSLLCQTCHDTIAEIEDCGDECEDCGDEGLQCRNGATIGEFNIPFEEAREDGDTVLLQTREDQGGDVLCDPCYHRRQSARTYYSNKNTWLYVESDPGCTLWLDDGGGWHWRPMDSPSLPSTARACLDVEEGVIELTAQFVAGGEIRPDVADDLHTIATQMWEGCNAAPIGPFELRVLLDNTRRDWGIELGDEALVQLSVHHGRWRIEEHAQHGDCRVLLDSTHIEWGDVWMALCIA